MPEDDDDLPSYAELMALLHMIGAARGKAAAGHRN
jgi:hypothetical protein